MNFETHKCGNTLDLILTNDTTLVSNMRSDVNSNFSDHYFVICDIDIELEKEQSNSDEISYLSKVPNFEWKKGTIEQLERYNEKINSNNWYEMFLNMKLSEKVKLFNDIVESAVASIFDNLMENKTCRKKIPRFVKETFFKEIQTI